jgi:zinc metalloprotease ZmpB
MKPLIITLTSCAALLNAVAQKPMPVSSLTIELPPENDTWRMNGNLRMAEKSGRPAALYGLSVAVTGASPEAMARNYLLANRALLGLNSDDVQNHLRLHVVQSNESGHTVRLRQYHLGLPVTGNAEITIHINPGNVVDYVMNGFVYGIGLTQATPAINEAIARQTALNHLGINGAVTGMQQQLKVLRNNGQDYLVYHFIIPVTQPLGEWDVFVNAQTGQLLQVVDKAAYHHDKRKKSPVRRVSPTRVTVNGTGNVFDPDPLTTATAVYGGSYVDGSDANAAVLTAQLKSVTLPDITLSAGTYSLVGPYADIRDFEAPNKGLFTQASSTFNFDRNADAFEAVNTYYHIDAMMRYLNVTLALGIMPYQYSGGVRFDPSGLNGADNSHYLGGSGQLAFGEGGVDDAEDADVIIHELGHGLHDWVTVGGLSQVNGLSEGTGDYIAGSYSRFKGYWVPANASYHFMFNWDGHNPFWNGRILNYTAVYPGGLVSAIHTDGQIWATAMMKIWDDIGRQKADRVFWRGLGLTSSSSNQNDAANAVYQMATTLGYTNAERLAIHTRFTAAGYTLPTFTLPVTWTDVSVTRNGADAQLKWSTASETGSRSYTVERSINGIDFTAINVLQAAGNSANSRHYDHTDVNAAAPGKKVFYRIKQTDANGAFTYSRVVSIRFDKQVTTEIFPNPARETITVKTTSGTGQAVIMNAMGKVVLRESFTASGNTFTMAIGALPEGVYTLQLPDGSSTRFVKSK